MTTKTISITESAYEKLANLKGAHESFSMVIERITQKRKLSDFAGVHSKKSGNKLQKFIEQERRRHAKQGITRSKKLVRMLG